MTNAESLIILVNSLSKSEKRKFRTGKKETDYIVLFDLIDHKNIHSVDILQEEFKARCPGSAFSISVKYLQKTILDSLLAIRQNTDSSYFLFTQVLKARILFEKSVYPAALDILADVKKKAADSEQMEILIYASNLERYVMLFLDMPGITEDDLVSHQVALKSGIRKLQELHEQLSLYELLKHRVLNKGIVRSQEERDTLNDLVFTEQHIAQKSALSQEALKRHLMFQAEYLAAVGNEKSANHVLLELLKVVNDNPYAENLLYHVQILQDRLENLRNTRQYKDIPVMVDRLMNIGGNSRNIDGQLKAVAALYSFLPLLDRGDFAGAKNIIDGNETLRPENLMHVNLSLAASICLYISLTYLGLKDYRKAKRALVQATLGGASDIPLAKTIRLTNLILRYKTGDEDFVFNETRSLHRSLSRQGKAYRMEALLLDMMSKGPMGMMSTRRREKYWENIAPKLKSIRSDVFERQLLKIFDFTAWVESEVRRLPLGDILRLHNEEYH